MDNSVELIGVYGDDETHALSAWTSTSRDLNDEKRGRIDKLLNMLAKEGHHSPFEKSYLHFLVTCDTASHIHLLKHRIGVSVNGESARYKELKEDKFYVPYDWSNDMVEEYYNQTIECYTLYHKFLNQLIDRGVSKKRAKESARFILPYSNQLVLDIGFNFRSFMHFQGLRNKDNAQDEIKIIAQKMLDLVRETGKFECSLNAFGYGE